MTEGARIAAQPPAGHQAAEPDAREDGPEHQREGQAAAVDEEVEEAEPDHLQRQQDRAGQERGGEEATGQRRERTETGARCVPRDSGGRQSARQHERRPRYQQRERARKRARSADAAPFDQQRLPDKRPAYRPERVHAVEPPEHRSEARVACAQRLHQDGQRRPHGRRWKQEQ